MLVNTRGVQSDEVKDKVFHALVNPRIPLSDRHENYLQNLSCLWTLNFKHPSVHLSKFIDLILFIKLQATQKCVGYFEKQNVIITTFREWGNLCQRSTTSFSQQSLIIDGKYFYSGEFVSPSTKWQFAKAIHIQMRNLMQNAKPHFIHLNKKHLSKIRDTRQMEVQLYFCK